MAILAAEDAGTSLSGSNGTRDVVLERSPAVTGGH
jgi:hypothetical protein